VETARTEAALKLQAIGQLLRKIRQQFALQLTAVGFESESLELLVSTCNAAMELQPGAQNLRAS
jgi:hypothetical protein